MEITPHTLLNYLLETSLCLTIFYAFYILVLRTQPTFTYNRVYLLISSLLALVFPVVEIPFFGTSSAKFSGVSPNFSMLMLPEMVVGETSTTVQTVSWQQVLLWGYGAGVLLMFVRFCWQIYGICHIIKQERLTVGRNRYWVVHTNGKLPISSFFNYLLWDNRAELSEADKQRIITHEEAHIAQGHSYDVMYMSLIKIILWFNPFTHLYFKELTDVHEYAADAKVVEKTNPREYAKILVNQLFLKGELSLLNHFYKSQTLKRLKMMELTQSKINRYRILWALPLFALMFFIFSCQEEEDTLAQAEASLESYESIQAEIQKANMALEAIIQQYPDYKMNFKGTSTSPIIEVGYEDDFFKAIEGVDNGKDKKTIAHLHYKLFQLQVKLQSSAMPDAKGIYAAVEEPPTPEGGMKAFYEHISRNLKFPVEARQQGIGGRAFVQFVVDTDGSLTEVETVKVQGEGVGFDKEAERVVRSAPAWNPGRQDGKTVKVKMILPITFILDSGDNTATEPKIREEMAAPKMREVVVTAYKPVE